MMHICVMSSHKPIRIYMGGLTLGVNTLYRLFCFFPMVGKGLINTNTLYMPCLGQFYINSYMVVNKLGTLHATNGPASPGFSVVASDIYIAALDDYAVGTRVALAICLASFPGFPAFLASFPGFQAFSAKTANS